MKILVTGAAGFIGSALSQSLLKNGHEIYGIDNLNDYYDPQLKKDRLSRLESDRNFIFRKLDISNKEAIDELFKTNEFNRVVHLAAQAGVRYSIENPYAYLQSNLTGFLNILEACRHQRIGHLIYASTSSVYGLSGRLPYKTEEDASHPVSFYGATKRANELMAHSYSALYNLPTTGLRFFTVYGPWGRPDMAFFKFTNKIIRGESIDVYNHGHHARDFTYIDDIVEGVKRVTLGEIPEENSSWNSKDGNPASSRAPFRVYNIGNNKSETLMRYIEVLENCIGKKAEKNFLPMQAGDVEETHADVSGLIEDFDYHPNTPIEVGLDNFVKWYRDYYKI